MRPYYQCDGITIYNADCRDVLPTLGRFDLLLTDPPYGLGDRLTGNSGEWSRHFQNAPEWDTDTVELELLENAISSATDSIIWGGNYYKLNPARCWLAWDKMQTHTSGHFELAWTTLDRPTRSFRMSRVEAYGNGKTHPTEKPLPLFQWCLKLVNNAASVVDPFMGTGVTLVAAKLAGMEAVGIERERRYCDAAVKRLAQNVFDFAE